MGHHVVATALTVMTLSSTSAGPAQVFRICRDMFDLFEQHTNKEIVRGITSLHDATRRSDRSMGTPTLR
jgi:hypothetical protein